MLTPPPPRGAPAEIEAFSGRSAFCTPKQLGPTRRTPPDRATATASACSLDPAGTDSAQHALGATAAVTALAAAATMMSGTVAAGVAMTARSISPGTSRRSGYAGRPATVAAWQTGSTSPG